MTTTTTPTSGAAIKRYKIGYHSDEWGVRSSTPSGIPDASGPWVRYEDHVTALKAAQPVVTSQPGVAYEALPDPWREKLAELAGQLEKCGVAWIIRTNGGTTYNVGRADGARVATSELRKVLNDELVNMLTAAPTHQPAPPQEVQEPVKLSDEQIKAHGDKASRMMARNLTRFDAACEVDKYLREQGAPGYYRHRMSIVLFGNDEGTEAARAPDTAPQPSPAAQGDALDAERYHYLRDVPMERWPAELLTAIRLQQNAKWDAAIDAARAAQEGKSHGN